MIAPKKLTNTDTLKKNMVEAMGKSLGIVSVACRMVNISRQTHYEWMREDPYYKQEIEELKNVVMDFVESRLMRLVKQGDTAATIYAAKCVLKDRGYIEKQQIDHTSDGKAITGITVKIKR